jgi:hypothetical protein
MTAVSNQQNYHVIDTHERRDVDIIQAAHIDGCHSLNLVRTNSISNNVYNVSLNVLHVGLTSVTVLFDMCSGFANVVWCENVRSRRMQCLGSKGLIVSSVRRLVV